MTKICFYFEVHQPERLEKLNYFDIYRDKSLLDDTLNRLVMEKVEEKCYLPMNQVLLDLIEKHQGKFKVSFALSGIFVEQAMKYAPKVIESFKKLAETGCVEFVAETYYHSLASVFSHQEFKEQIKLHEELMLEVFGQKPTIFRNTELIYRNDVARVIRDMGYKAMLMEGLDPILQWRSPHYVYHAKDLPDLSLMLKSYRLSDDMAYRFSDKGWSEYPLMADRYASWLHQLPHDQQVINLFMDYETFGEHHWEDTGIFDFFSAVPDHVLKDPRFEFSTISEAIEAYKPVDVIDVPNFVSWADSERDLSAWLGNPIQNDLFNSVNALEHDAKHCGDPKLLHLWRKFTTSDHYYYLCTKGSFDGNVHQYFSPFENPNVAYNHAMNDLADLAYRIQQKLESIN